MHTETMENKTLLKKRINFEIPEDIHQAIKMYAVSNNMTIKMFILRCVIEELVKAGAIKLKR